MPADGPAGGEFATLLAPGFNNESPWTSLPVDEDVFRSVQLTVVRFSSHPEAESSATCLFYTPSQYFKSGPKFLKPRGLQDTPDYEECRPWLENCQVHHGPECNYELSAKIDGLQLFDCQSAKVIPADIIENPHWVALSYVWAKGVMLTQTR